MMDRSHTSPRNWAKSLKTKKQKSYILPHLCSSCFDMLIMTLNRCNFSSINNSCFILLNVSNGIEINM